ncbi:methylated-DNA--[protein]-cysteine S-methyltransferase [Cohnella luojiensis]|uniref:Methylated-DNA--protein-cysteine methyltransferase n=1 Tax=Cohnella luojiensis TaxID=652876 RepID=A0A4Y8LN60_9BACL|nr:methylated-DNA--[protein]-cysteine S-methyltransferase [Cohnella luojiensis]
MNLYWATINQGNDQLIVAASEQGLCYVGGWGESLRTFQDWAEKNFRGYEQVMDESRMEPFVQQLEEYFAGQRTSFTMPLDLRGTPFQMSVWEAMGKIPYGRTASYLDVAESLQRPKSVRAVGTAIGRNPVLIVAPCHRIIGKNGALTGYRGGLPMKERLLQHEKTASMALR